MRLSLRAKLSFAVLSTLLLVLAAALLLMARAERHELYSSIDRRAEVVTGISRQQVQALLVEAARSRTLINRMLHTGLETGGLQHIIVTDGTGLTVKELRAGPTRPDVASTIARHVGTVIESGKALAEAQPRWGILHRFEPLYPADGSGQLLGVLGMEWPLDRPVATIERDALRLARRLGGELAALLTDLQQDRENLQRMAEQLARLDDVRHVEIFDADGLVIAHSLRDKVGGRDLAHGEKVAMALATGTVIQKTAGDSIVREIFIPVPADPDSGTEPAVIEIVMDGAETGSRIATMTRRMLGLAAVLALGLAAVLLYTVRRLVLKPLTRVAALVSHGDPVAPGPVWSDDELGRLGSELEQVLNQRRAMESEIRDKEQQFRTLLDSAPDGILVADDSGRIILVNDQVLELFGYQREQLVGSQVEVLVPESSRSSHVALRHDYASHPHTRSMGQGMNLQGQRRDGSLFPVEISLSSTPTTGGRVAIAIIRDVTEREAMQERQVRLAFYDSLTDLPNRTLFRDRLEQAMVRARRQSQLMGLMFLDLDRFKEVNDTLGHEAGDLLLRQVAQRLTGSVRRSDTVARLGGDEFTVITENVQHIDQIALVAEKILQAFRQPFDINGHKLYSSTSIGIVVWPLDESGNIDELIKSADAAMYHSKQQGRNRYSFYARDMTRGLARRLDLSNRLHGALDRNEFELIFQPQVALRDGSLAGVEVDVRWHHPQEGLLGSGVFESLVTNHSVAIPLMIWMLDQAAAQWQSWQEQCAVAPDLTIRLHGSVPEKLSALLARVLELSANGAFDPDRLVVSLPDNIGRDDSMRARSLLRTLHGLGVRIALEDTGGGKPPLARLRQLPADRLILGAGLVAGILTDAVDRALVEAVGGIAQRLKLELLAKGVEENGQKQVLQDIGCARIQGPLVADAMDGDSLVRWLRGYTDKTRSA